VVDASHRRLEKHPARLSGWPGAITCFVAALMMQRPDCHECTPSLGLATGGNPVLWKPQSSPPCRSQVPGAGGGVFEALEAGTGRSSFELSTRLGAPWLHGFGSSSPSPQCCSSC
jgi:hypothetical protein